MKILSSNPGIYLTAIGIFLIFLLITAFQSDRSREQTQLSSGLAAPDSLEVFQWITRADTLQAAQQYDSANVYYRRAAERLEPLINPRADSTLADRYYYCQYRIAFHLVRKRENEKSLPFLLPLVDSVPASINPSVALGNIYLCVGNAYDWVNDHRQTLDYYERAAAAYAALSPPAYERLSTIYQKIAVAHLNIEEYSPAIEAYRKSVDYARLQANGKESARLASLHQAFGYDYNFIGDQRNAMVQFKEALRIARAIYEEDNLRLADAYNDLGIAYRDQENYEQALEYLRKDLAIRLGKMDEDHPDLLRTYNNLGTILNGLGAFSEAGAYLEKGIRIIENTTWMSNSTVHGILSNNLGVAYRGMGAYEEARRYLQQAVAIGEQIQGVGAARLAGYYNDLGKLYQMTGAPVPARQNFERSIEVSRGVFGNYHPEIAESYLALGALHVQAGQYEAALRDYQQAIGALVVDYDREDIFARPDISGNVTSAVSLLEVLTEKGRTLQALYRRDGEAKAGYLSAAADHLELAAGLIDVIRQGYDRESAKARLTDQFFTTYELGLNILYETRREGMAGAELPAMFRLLEKSKAALLLESIKEEEARAFAGLPPDLLERERELKIRLTEMETVLFKERQDSKGADAGKTAVTENRIFRLKQSRDSLIAYLESAYPAYYRLKYDVQVAEVGEVQAKLPKDGAALIEYFVGDSTLFTFVLTAGESFCLRQAIEPRFYEAVEGLQRVLHQYRGPAGKDDDQRRAEFLTYAEHAHWLYQYLLEPALARTAATDLIIVPDGPLGYLPFEALLTEPAGADGAPGWNYQQPAYLLKRRHVRYEYSATLLLQEELRERRSTRRFAGFAPTYFDGAPMASRTEVDTSSLTDLTPGRRNVLAPLFFTQPEVEEISATIGGDIFTGETATESLFKEKAGAYRMLHLAMHAFVNDQNPNYSHLAFSKPPDSLDDRYLNAAELYNMELNAELAVLSACETGVGRLQRGEGVISLSRAFKYAGCPNIVTSLWQANDASTRNLMTAFYQQLKQGKGKGEALREAKLALLEQDANPQWAHPFYWATFVLVGDDEAVVLPSPYGNYLLWGGLALIVLLGAGVWWRRRSII